MRLRLLPAVLALPLLAAVAPAHAGCDENGCYPQDCVPWTPHVNVQQSVYYATHGDPGRAVTSLGPCG